MAKETMDGTFYLSNMRSSLNRQTSHELKLLEKIVFIDLFDQEQIGASKVYMNSLIRSALNEPNKPNNNNATSPRVVVLDGRDMFNEHEFAYRFVKEKDKLEQVQIFRPLDDLILLMTIEEKVTLNLATNLNCQLIVIIPHSKTMFPDLFKAINRRLFPSDIHINVIILVESLSNRKYEIFKETPFIEVIRCEFELPDRTPHKDAPIRASREETLSITSSKSNTQITKVVRFIS